MISVSEYKKNPCAAYSIPYWKQKNIIIPDTMKIVHECEFSENLLDTYHDEPYFRLFHDMSGLSKPQLNGFHIITASDNDFNLMTSIINRSYPGTDVNSEYFMGLTKTPVYHADLWILVVDNETGKCAGSGIGDFDPETDELIVEWIQVLPEFRKKGLGRFLVNELLFRMKDVAEFATVSGQINNETNPQALYRSCGFAGDDVWHIYLPDRRGRPPGRPAGKQYEFAVNFSVFASILPGRRGHRPLPY